MRLPETAIAAPPLPPSSGEARFRTEMGQISRHSAVFFAGTLFSGAAGYLFKIYVARMLGAELLGIYALGMTVVGLLSTVAALGFPDAAGRFVPAYLGTKRLQALQGFLGRSLLTVLGASALMGLLTVLGAHWIAIRLYHSTRLERFMPLFAVLVVTTAVGGLFGQLLAGFKDVARRTVITMFVGAPLMMVIAFVLLQLGVGLSGYITAQIVSGVIVLFLLAQAVWKLTPPAIRSLTPGLPHLESEAIHFSAAVFGVACITFLIGQADKMLLGFFLDASKVGIYAVAGTLVAFVPIVLQTVNQIFAPVIADLHARGERNLIGKLYQTLTKWIVGLTFPLILVMIVFPRVLMRLFGADFVEGWPILVIGVVGQLVNCGVGSVGQLLLMSGNQSRLVRIQTVMAVLTVVLNAALIPWWGIIGAAVAGTVVNIANNIWCLGVVRKVLGISPYNRSYLGLILPGGISTLCVMFLRRFEAGALPGGLLVLLALSVGYLTFIAPMLLVGLDEDDRTILGAIWNRVRQAFTPQGMSAS